MNDRGRVMAVVGGCWGSEGKGNIVHYLADRFNVHCRTGGPNAGHSFYFMGRVWKQCMLPCGWTNPNAELILGPGAIVNFEVLSRELADAATVDPTVYDRTWVDGRAVVLESRHRDQSKQAGRTARIGATGEGVGSARLARVARDPSKIFQVKDYPEIPVGIKVLDDTSRYVNYILGAQKSIMLEGTQGSGLSLIHGPWPYTTSHDTTAATLAADMGIPPHYVTDVLLVLRTYPIRVAGTSGPMYNEISWSELSNRLGKEVLERTTVTKKIRRIGEWDHDLVDQSVMLNGPTAFALNFVDYLNPEDEGKTSFADLSDDAHAFVNYLESFWERPVALLGTGGEGFKVVDRGIL